MPFNNYVDKMRGRGQKMYVFVHIRCIKTVHGGCSKKWQNSVHVVVEWPIIGLQPKGRSSIMCQRGWTKVGLTTSRLIKKTSQFLSFLKKNLINRYWVYTRSKKIASFCSSDDSRASSSRAPASIHTRKTTGYQKTKKRVGSAVSLRLSKKRTLHKKCARYRRL